jgi:hypothetical protein
MYIILYLVRNESVDEAIVLVKYASETGFLQKEFALIDLTSVMGGRRFSFSKYIISLKCYSFYNKLPFLMGTAVAQWLRYCATNHKVAGSFPDGVTEFFIDVNSSDRAVALGSTQPLIKMSTGSISWW